MFRMLPGTLQVLRITEAWFQDIDFKWFPTLSLHTLILDEITGDVMLITLLSEISLIPTLQHLKVKTRHNIKTFGCTFQTLIQCWNLKTLTLHRIYHGDIHDLLPQDNVVPMDIDFQYQSCTLFITRH